MLPEAPGASVSGLPVVPVLVCVTVPVFVDVGGLGFDTTVWEMLELFWIVITN